MKIFNKRGRPKKLEEDKTMVRNLMQEAENDSVSEKKQELNFPSPSKEQEQEEIKVILSGNENFILGTIIEEIRKLENKIIEMEAREKAAFKAFGFKE